MIAAEATGAGTGEGPVPDFDAETGPERRCIASFRVGPAEAMLRFVIGPDDQVVPDIECRLPGRGMWLSAGADMINTALAKNLFSKAARRRVVADAGLASIVERLLAARCVATIGLARRAGQAMMGFEKVLAEVKAGRGQVVLAASDGAADGRDKIRNAAGTRPVVAVLTAAEIGGAFGRDHAVHAILGKGRLADRLMCDAGRLAGFRG